MSTIFQPYKEGDTVEMQCYNWNGEKASNPSEWTGKIAIILKNLNPGEQFLEESFGAYTADQWNHAIAKDIFYNVLIGKKIRKINHLCFIKETIDWATAIPGTPSVYCSV